MYSKKFLSERNKKYLELDSFLMNITFLCEIYHHVRIDSRICLKVLSRPIIDYFGMMVDGGSQKEVEVLVEQVIFISFKNIKIVIKKYLLISCQA